MTRSGLSNCVSLFVLFSAAVPAGAQTLAGFEGPIPVSPGSTGQPTLAQPCPSFSWAPREWAPGHELAVYELQGGTLASAPSIRALLPGRASTWTPAESDCLRQGSTYLWFVREVTAAAEPVGDWSAGSAFTVVESVWQPDAYAGDLGAASGRSADSRTQQSGAVIAAQPPNVPPDSIQDKLISIEAKLDQLLDPVSREVCIELGLELEGHVEYGGSIDGEFEGRVGAEGFGNGVMGKIKAKPGFEFGAQLKGAAVPKAAFCYAFDPIFSAASDPTQIRMASAFAGPEAIDADAITERLLNLVEVLDLSESRMAAALDAIPAFGVDGDPWGSLRQGGVLQQAADVLPIPESLRDQFSDPGQIIESFRSQLALCQQSNLPPAVAALVGDFCALVANEPFKKLLDRVDTAVTNVQTKVENILGQLPTSDNCKFFCGSDDD